MTFLHDFSLDISYAVLYYTTVNDHCIHKYYNFLTALFIFVAMKIKGTRNFLNDLCNICDCTLLWQ